MERENKEREVHGDSLMNTRVLTIDNREVEIMFLQMTMILFGIALIFKLLGEML